MQNIEFTPWATPEPENRQSRTMLTTQRMLKRHAAGLDRDQFSDLETNAQLLTWFFEHGQQRLVNSENIVRVFFEHAFTSIEEIDRFFQNARLFEYFELLEEDPNILYLKDLPDEYPSAAEKLTQTLPEKDRFTAAAHLALNAMMLAIHPNDLPADLLKAILQPWKAQSYDAVYVVEPEMVFAFGWEGLSAAHGLKQQILWNEKSYPINMKITGPMGNVTIILPPRGRLTAVFCGSKMTCIKGALRTNGRFVAAFHGSEILKIKLDEKRRIRQQLPDPESVHDFALASGGGVHQLQDGTAVVLDPSGKQKHPDGVGVFSLDHVWVVLRQDGSTVSNNIRLIHKDIISAVQTGDDILLMSRDGKIRSCKQQDYSKEDFWQCMMARFCGLPEGIVEQITCGGAEVQLTRSGEMLDRDQHGSGG